MRYVLEGSALGGRVILRQLKPLGLSEAAGASYFAGDGPETGRRWTTFLARLEAVGTPKRRPGVIAGAFRAFEALTAFASAHLDERLDPRQDLAPPLAAVEDAVMTDADL